MSNQAAPRQFNRNDYYAKLAIGKKDLGWDDEFYYGIWLPMQGASKKPGTEQYSASTLSNTQLFKALSEMQRCGFKVQSKNGNKAGSRPQADDAQSKKIRALWLELHAAGKVRDQSEASLAAYVKRQTKVEALQWLSTPQASRVIESLKSWLARRSPDAAQRNPGT